MVMMYYLNETVFVKFELMTIDAVFLHATTEPIVFESGRSYIVENYFFIKQT